MSFWLKRVESFLEQVDHTAASQISSLKQGKNEEDITLQYTIIDNICFNIYIHHHPITLQLCSTITNT